MVAVGSRVRKPLPPPDLAEAITGSAEQGVLWWSTVEKFSRGGSGLDPSFSETEKVRVANIDHIGECCSMKRMKNEADVESAQSEG